MRRASKVDANHTKIVDAFRRHGWRVLSLAGVGHGVPDLLVCDATGRMLLVEVKDGSKPPSERKLTPDQVKFHAEWPAPIHIVSDIGQAIRIAIA